MRPPPGRPQGSPHHLLIRPRPYYDHEAALGGARSHSKGRGGDEGMRGPLWLPWGGVGPLAHLITNKRQGEEQWRRDAGTLVVALGRRGAARIGLAPSR